MAGYRFTLQMDVVVEVDDVDSYATDEGGLGLDDVTDYSLDDVKASLEHSLAGFLANEVNNCNEMPMQLISAHATVTETADLGGAAL